jgi:hypothetical protein
VTSAGRARDAERPKAVDRPAAYDEINSLKLRDVVVNLVEASRTQRPRRPGRGRVTTRAIEVSFTTSTVFDTRSGRTFRTACGSTTDPSVCAKVSAVDRAASAGRAHA